MFLFPRYRYLTQKYNFDDYSSKGSAVHPVKKYNRAIQGATVEGQPGGMLAIEGHIHHPHTRLVEMGGG